MKIRILFDFNGNVNGKARHFEEGTIVDVPEEAANEFIDALEAIPAGAMEHPKPRKPGKRQEADE